MTNTSERIVGLNELLGRWPTENEMTRTRFEAALEKRQAVKDAEASGTVADSMEVRLALMERVRTGEIQVRDIHYVEIEPRSTWEFCQLLDRKYLQSSRRSLPEWLALANKNGWIKPND